MIPTIFINHFQHSPAQTHIRYGFAFSIVNFIDSVTNFLTTCIPFKCIISIDPAVNSRIFCSWNEFVYFYKKIIENTHVGIQQGLHNHENLPSPMVNKATKNKIKNLKSISIGYDFDYDCSVFLIQASEFNRVSTHLYSKY